MPATAYVFPPSQPSRALLWFLSRNKIHADVKIVDLLKGENVTPEYTAVNPLQAVPAFKTEEGENLTESGAILVYLAQVNKLTNEYPSDVKAQFKVNEALLRHQTLARQISVLGLRPSLARLHKPELTIAELRALVAPGKAELQYVLGLLDAQLSKTAFIAGDSWSVADYLVLAEVSQLALLKVVLPEECTIEHFPSVARYIGEAEKLEGYADFVKPAAFISQILAERKA